LQWRRDLRARFDKPTTKVRTFGSVFSTAPASAAADNFGGFFVLSSRNNTMATNQIVAYSPPTVWQVPETFKSVYSHAVEV
jgi:hypothetical protein